MKKLRFLNISFQERTDLLHKAIVVNVNKKLTLENVDYKGKQNEDHLHVVMRGTYLRNQTIYLAIGRTVEKLNGRCLITLFQI